MINNKTRTILKSLLSINNSMVIKYPTMTVSDTFKSIFCRVDLTKIDENFETFGIYDTSNFLSALDLLKDPEITLEDNKIIAKDQETKMQFVTSDVDSLDSTFKESIIDRTMEFPSLINFDFTTDMLNKIKKAAGVFKTMDCLYLNNNTTVDVELGQFETFEISQNTYTIQIPTPVSDKEFKLAIPLENILKLPSTDYKLEVRYNEEKNAYRIVFKNEIYTFILSLMD
jgi:hypothetical protein